jgi:hypothetical protein
VIVSHVVEPVGPRDELGVTGHASERLGWKYFDMRYLEVMLERSERIELSRTVLTRIHLDSHINSTLIGSHSDNLLAAHTRCAGPPSPDAGCDERRRPSDDRSHRRTPPAVRKL